MSHGQQTRLTTTSSGTIYTSVRDLSRFSRAVLSNEILSAQRTARWLKPYSHTSSLTMSVGAPWEIYRSSSLTSGGQLIDLYTKDGGLGLYGSLSVLVPDFDLAITVLIAGDGSPTTQVANLVIGQIIPAIDSIAKKQAAARFAGSYKKGNSSLVVSTDSGLGLKVTSWFGYGHDILAAYAEQFQPFELRIYPSILRRSNTAYNDMAKTVQSFRGVYQYAEAQYDNFLGQCSSWEGFDGNVYGQEALDEFVFHLDRNGNAASMEPSVLRQVLDKV